MLHALTINGQLLQVTTNRDHSFELAILQFIQSGNWLYTEGGHSLTLIIHSDQSPLETIMKSKQPRYFLL